MVPHEENMERRHDLPPSGSWSGMGVGLEDEQRWFFLKPVSGNQGGAKSPEALLNHTNVGLDLFVSS